MRQIVANLERIKLPTEHCRVPEVESMVQAQAVVLAHLEMEVEIK